MTIMPPMSPLLCPLLVLLLPFCAAASHLRPSDGPTAYEVLQSYDFPVGILPQGVLDYDLDPSTGRFAARFGGSCSFSLEGSYQLRYKPTITGYISSGRLTDLKGVSVKVLLFWVNIVEVTRRGDDLQFSVGIASADFSVDSFLVCPQCGCGLDCLGLRLPSSVEERSPRLKFD